MVGISGQNVLLRPIRETWELRTRFDMGLLRVAHVLGV